MNIPPIAFSFHALAYSRTIIHILWSLADSTRHFVVEDYNYHADDFSFLVVFLSQ